MDAKLEFYFQAYIYPALILLHHGSFFFAAALLLGFVFHPLIRISAFENRGEACYREPVVLRGEPECLPEPA